MNPLKRRHNARFDRLAGVVEFLEPRRLFSASPSAETVEYLPDRYTIKLDPDIAGSLARSALEQALSSAQVAAKGLFAVREFLLDGEFISLTAKAGAAITEVTSAVRDVPGFVELLRVPVFQGGRHPIG